jgi:hypothetical protein
MSKMIKVDCKQFVVFLGWFSTFLTTFHATLRSCARFMISAKWYHLEARRRLEKSGKCKSTQETYLCLARPP